LTNWRKSRSCRTQPTELFGQPSITYSIFLQFTFISKMHTSSHEQLCIYRYIIFKLYSTFKHEDSFCCRCLNSICLSFYGFQNDVQIWCTAEALKSIKIAKLHSGYRQNRSS
jgi:hypothetical protein